MAKYIFITGATSGFGEASARLFAENGWNLILTGRREERLQKIKQELENTHAVSVTTLCFDVRDEKAVNASIEGMPIAIKQNIEIVLNNAGLAVGRNSIEEGITDDWDRMVDTNIKGLLYVTRAVVPYLKENKKGHIFNLGSIAGKEVYAGGNVYCATKHAVDALSKAMRIDLVEYGIKVTNIAPGAAETEFSLVRFKGDAATAKNIYQGFEPLQAKDIAETIYFVATRPAHVTINDLTIMPTAQASATVFSKKS